MVWRRLPTLFPNIRMRMLPLTEAQLKQVKETGWTREVAFRTEPRVNKMEIKAFLERVHHMEVERVSTINYRGKKKRAIDNKGRAHYYRRSDWKKAYVIFKPPADVLKSWQKEQKQQQAERQKQEAEQRQAAFQKWRQRHPYLFGGQLAGQQQQYPVQSVQRLEQQPQPERQQGQDVQPGQKEGS